MVTDELQFDTLNQRNLQVLTVYAERHLAARTANNDYAGWLDRVESTGDLDADQLTRVHGELIALGMLRFELTNRQTGLRYQISDRGHDALRKQTSVEDAADVNVDEDVTSDIESTETASRAA